MERDFRGISPEQERKVPAKNIEIEISGKDAETREIQALSDAVHDLSEYLRSARERVRNGNHPFMFELAAEMEKYSWPGESTEDKVLREGTPAHERYADKRALAERRLKGIASELGEVIRRGGTEQDVLKKILKITFDQTTYTLDQNALLEVFAKEGKPEANCQARSKAVGAILEMMGYNPSSQIFLEFFSDHVRTLVKSKEGQMFVMEGSFPQSWEPTKGTVVLSQNELKEEVLGMRESKDSLSSVSAFFHTGTNTGPDRVWNKNVKFKTRSLQTSGYASARYSNHRFEIVVRILSQLDSMFGKSVKNTSKQIDIMQDKQQQRPIFGEVIKHLLVIYPHSFLAGAGSLIYINTMGIDSREKLAEAIRDAQVSQEEIDKEITETITKLVKTYSDTKELVQKIFQENKKEIQSDLPSGLTPIQEPTRTIGSATSLEGEMIVDIMDEIPRALSRQWEREYDLIDWIVRDTHAGSQFPHETISPDEGVLTIEPKDTEIIVTNGVWRQILLEMHKTDVAKVETGESIGEFSNKLTVRFLSQNPQFDLSPSIDNIDTIISEFAFSDDFDLVVSVNDEKVIHATRVGVESVPVNTVSDGQVASDILSILRTVVSSTPKDNVIEAIEDTREDFLATESKADKRMVMAKLFDQALLTGFSPILHSYYNFLDAMEFLRSVFSKGDQVASELIESRLKQSHHASNKEID